MKWFESYRMRWVAVGVVTAISLGGNVRAKGHLEFGLPTNAGQAAGDADARGFTSLIAAGSLFSDDFGPPINFHGIDEGAPIDDLHLSGQILWHILLREVDQRSDALVDTQRNLSRE